MIAAHPMLDEATPRDRPFFGREQRPELGSKDEVLHGELEQPRRGQASEPGRDAGLCEQVLGGGDATLGDDELSEPICPPPDLVRTRAPTGTCAALIDPGAATALSLGLTSASLTRR